MKYRKLGGSELIVSEIAFGSWLTFSTAEQKKSAIACVHRALDRGITLIDTANVYGRGAAERVLGEALAGIRRDSYVLATKLFFPMSETDRGLSRAQVLKQIDASLERLKVPYVDLYQCHRYDADTPLEETMEALTEVVRAGKARYIGFSEWPVDRIEAALRMPACREIRLEPAAVFAPASRPGARAHTALRASGHFANRVVAARAGRFDRQIPAGQAGAGRQPCGQRLDEGIFQSRPGSSPRSCRRSNPSSPSPPRRASHWRNLRSPGSFASPTWPPPSSGRRVRNKSMRMSPLPDTSCPGSSSSGPSASSMRRLPPYRPELNANPRL